MRYALQHADPGTAEDVASETFLVAWRRLADVPADPPLPWLLGSHATCYANSSAGPARTADHGPHPAITTDADLMAWDAGEHVVERAAALEALGPLQADDAEALTLVTWHGLSAAEAAEVVGCSPHAFTVRLHRARRRLADALLRATTSRVRLLGRYAPTRVPGAQVPLLRRLQGNRR